MFGFACLLMTFLFCAPLALVAYFWARRYKKRLKLLTDTPECRAKELAGVAPGLAKMHGSVVAPSGLLNSPMSNTRCVYYRFLVEEERQEVRTVHTSKGGLRNKVVKVWVPIVDDRKCVTCALKDETGAVEVMLAEAEMDLQASDRLQSGLFSSPPARLKKLLEEQYGKSTRVLLFNKKMRFKEEVIEDGGEVFVVGKVALLKTEKGKRPRFIKGEQPLIVTDKDEAGLTSAYKRKVLLGTIGWISGASVFALVTILLLLAALVGGGR
jgi:hypothetical protein